jgi:hypothetical protein
VTPSGPRNKQRRGPPRLPLPARAGSREICFPLSLRDGSHGLTRARNGHGQRTSLRRPIAGTRGAHARIFRVERVGPRVVELQRASELIRATSARQVGEVNALVILLVNNKTLWCSIARSEPNGTCTVVAYDKRRQSCSSVHFSRSGGKRLPEGIPGNSHGESS